MKYIIPVWLLVSISACAASRQNKIIEQPTHKETWWLSKPTDGLGFLLTWYKFPLTLETVDFFARGPEFYVRIEWSIKDGETINANNFKGEIIGYMGNAFVISEGDIHVVAIARDAVELKFNVKCKMKHGTGAPMEIKETKRFSLQQSAPSLKFESKNAEIETLPDSLRQLRSNTFNWSDGIFEPSGKRTFNVVQDFDGKCTSKPCEYYVHNRMFADSIQHFMFLNRNAKIELGFHTDTRGSESYNEMIAEEWSKTTKELLVKRGVSESRITAVGYGESKPLVSDSTINKIQDKVFKEKIHALNRRFGQVRILSQ